MAPDPSQGGHDPSAIAGTTPPADATVGGVNGATAAPAGGAYTGAAIIGAPGTATGAAGYTTGCVAICGCGYTGGANGGA
jgi:hypothetical protein